MYPGRLRRLVQPGAEPALGAVGVGVGEQRLEGGKTYNPMEKAENRIHSLYTNRVAKLVGKQITIFATCFPCIHNNMFKNDFPLTGSLKCTVGFRSTCVPAGTLNPDRTIGSSVLRETSVPLGKRRNVSLMNALV